MSERLRGLRLVLEEVGVPLTIDTVEDRLVLQKAVYLAQSKVNLGYSYGWYLKGPYSPKLTQDYYELADEIRLGGEEPGTLRADVREALASIRELIAAAPAQMRRSHWLELLASLDFLVKKSGLALAVAKERIATLKPHLIPHIDEGAEALQL
jgi:hypothetical protein